MNNKEKILFIDCSAFEQLHFAIIAAGKVSAKKKKIKYPQTENALSYLAAFLKAQHAQPTDFAKIIIVSGPGSFTGIRVGAAIALAFSLAGQIPLYALAKKQLPDDLAALAQMKLKKISADFKSAYGAAARVG